MTYPASPGFAAGSETSKGAADALTGRDAAQREVLKALYHHRDGLIVDEIKIVIEKTMGREFDRSTVAARCTELEARLLIHATEGRRMSARNRPAAIYKITIDGEIHLFPG